MRVQVSALVFLLLVTASYASYDFIRDYSLRDSEYGEVTPGFIPYEEQVSQDYDPMDSFFFNDFDDYFKDVMDTFQDYGSIYDYILNIEPRPYYSRNVDFSKMNYRKHFHLA